jgi:flagellar basal-body rod protein FlgC
MMNLIPSVDVTASALSAEKVRLDVVSQNIANAHTTRGPDGEPYSRKVVSFEAEMARAGGQGSKGVRVGQVTEDKSLGPLVYNPSHPDADSSGMVRMPNVNLAMEMVDLMTASRSYEANLSVVRTARQMAQKALKIGQ